MIPALWREGVNKVRVESCLLQTDIPQFFCTVMRLNPWMTNKEKIRR